MRCDDIVVLGLSLSSSWGNGHATTWRALIRGLAELGQKVLFLERDQPWYAANRDLPVPDFCELGLYGSRAELYSRYGSRIAEARAVLCGSYLPEGIAVIDDILALVRGPCGFYDIDTPVTVAALARKDCDYLAARQIRAFDFYLSFTGGPMLGLLSDRYEARRPVAFHCAVDAERYQPVAVPPRWDLGYLGTFSADRQPALERLLLEPARRLPQCRFVVAGPQYPDDIAWPANVTRIAHVAPAEHPAFYAAQRFTLNITRADMIAAGWSPSVRLFEAAACATPIISDDWPGLTDLLPAPTAILIAEDSDAVTHILRHVSDTARRRMAAEARSIVLKAHTGQARARVLLRLLDALASASVPLMPVSSVR
ncbi:CgeB family protein [Rhodopila sp.]|uniref:CgeB family protein n=1 Tax=Rhodopila sp. TaxID=2480087 RepID=UPI002D148F14|nr:glycosyltransferase [Rhodopila sp.]HVZ07485.1 glycosyltransferase [Rhodopila sp.]